MTPSIEAFETLLANRRSCRGYQSKPVDRAVIEHILTAAQRTPSWCNAQPWHLYLVGGARLDRLRDVLHPKALAGDPESPDIPFPREYRGVYRERRRACGWGLYETVGVAKGDRQASAEQGALNFRMFGAPHLAIVTSDEALGTYGAIDCGAYVTSFMLAAEALGVSSIAQAALAGYPDVLRAELGIPTDRVIVCGISFGYADESVVANRFRTVRAPIEENTSWVE